MKLQLQAACNPSSILCIAHSHLRAHRHSHTHTHTQTSTHTQVLTLWHSNCNHLVLFSFPRYDFHKCAAKLADNFTQLSAVVLPKCCIDELCLCLCVCVCVCLYVSVCLCASGVSVCNACSIPASDVIQCSAVAGSL